MSNDELKPMEQSEHHRGAGQFATGLFIGGVAAAVGMFLFGTKRGEKVTRDMKKQWQKIEQAALQEIPARPNDKIKLPFLQVVQHTLEFAARRLQQSQNEFGKLQMKEGKKDKTTRSAQRGK